MRSYKYKLSGKKEGQRFGKSLRTNVIHDTIAIISTRGPSIISSSLLSPHSSLRRASVPACNPCIGLYYGSKSDSDSESNEHDHKPDCRSISASDLGLPAYTRKRLGSTRESRQNHYYSELNSKKDDARNQEHLLLVTEINDAYDITNVRNGLARVPDAQCLVEFYSDGGRHPCIMTLREDGFVWNQDAFLNRWSSQYASVARRNPFMRRLNNSSEANSSRRFNDINDGGNSQYDEYGDEGDELVPIDDIHVHEIYPEECPNLY